MILSGVLLRNVNNGLIISGLVPSWSKQIRAAALAIIFLRSGLEIDLDVGPLKSLHSMSLRLWGCPSAYSLSRVVTQPGWGGIQAAMPCSHGSVVSWNSVM